MTMALVSNLKNVLANCCSENITDLLHIHSKLIS